MISLIEQIKLGKLWDFPGGIQPSESKAQSLQRTLIHASLPNRILLPIKQHIGKSGGLLVEIGEYVLKGQALTKYDTNSVLPIHAPTSGTITAIKKYAAANSSGLAELCIVILPDGKDKWLPVKPVDNFLQESPDRLIEYIKQAGISGMGGAGFPTAKKIQSIISNTDIFIVNAAECEPYITADHALIQYHADEVIQGIEIVKHILKPKLIVIGIEDNKPEAIEALNQSTKNKEFIIRIIPTKYPSGGEKQLIKILTNKEVPSGGIPSDIGILVQNVSSLHAIKRAICDGKPLINRILTLSGEKFKKPRNVWALIGTSIQTLLVEFGHEFNKKTESLILGGPMMGITLPHADIPVTKTTNCILISPKKQKTQDEMPCIRCGQCSDACPVSLLPQQLQWHAKAKEFDQCEKLNLGDCIECGACDYVCPSQIPLVKYYRQAKKEIQIRNNALKAAKRAKKRFKEKNQRTERDRIERETALAKISQERRKKMKSADNARAISDAVARVKARTRKNEQPIIKTVSVTITEFKTENEKNLEPDNIEMIKLRNKRKKEAKTRKNQKEKTLKQEKNFKEKK
ncbi:electron transport complex protein [Candidatus Photodesmus blepharus]|uniref:Ion-translocating oxidoreductase complex subunit C n=1 Tax=Candidatus Photodesmus blepharonis TaxID=1179155 RepID=A0A084CN18_9GAMM|nr:electron transport complex subunit RsxC [Candidatus Photodesmus blepharus]KEY91197.1 electron transport complex protein [Candidatus Photodesmus blepharus]